MIIISNVAKDVKGGWEWGLGPVVKRSERKSIISTENGQVSSLRVTDGTTGSYHLQFITLEPNSLFLPVVLHSDMVFYVHTGSGKLSWMDEHEQKSADLRIGDVFRLPFGSIFFLESSLEPTRQKLRLYSIFANSEDDLREPLNEPYSSIRNMVLGFDKKVLQAAFHVPEDVIEQVLAETQVPAIVHGVPKSTKKKKKSNLWEMEAQFMTTVLGRGSYSFFDNKKSKKKKSSELFNVFREKPDFENCNGWSTVINRRKLPALKGSQIGIYVVNLTKGSMMGPHWNPMATEIGIAIQGEGMVRVVCSNTGTGQGCKNMRFKVDEGDVFVVPRFHPMAQMAFNNNSFVFVGFSTTTKKHHPQYLAGKASVLRTLDRHILEASFNVTNTTMDQILEAQGDSVILECTSCAEEEKRLMEEERKREEEETRRKEEEEARKKEEEERKKQEEARRKEEEEARKAEEERKKREAEETRKREEEAAKEKEEERKRQEEAARKREEEEAKRQEEEIRRRQEEEEAKKRKEEEERERQEARRREEEEEAAARRQQEEEAARKREEEEAKRQEEEIRRRQEKEEAKKRKEEEERERQEAEEARKRQEEKEAARRREEEEAQREAEEARRREEEEAARRKQEEEAQREAEEARREEEEAETRRQEEEARRREEEEAARRKQEEEAQREAEEARREEEEAETRRQEEEARRSEEEKQREAEEEAQREAEESRRREEEEAAKRQEEEETEREAEEARKRPEEAARKQEEEEARKQEAAKEEAERQGEEARRQEEEMEKRHQEEETKTEEPGRHERIFLKSSMMINGVHT
uniref:Cupin type-1 domain-containing protein n=1 Tax=Solanum melongena TaxID=223891 RepID=A9XLD3_SOLME|nr:unknown [Solanum melongena]